jgi:hypothetical protein
MKIHQSKPSISYFIMITTVKYYCSKHYFILLKLFDFDIFISKLLLTTLIDQ